MGATAKLAGTAVLLLLTTGCAPLKSIRDGDIRDHVFGKRYDCVDPRDPLMHVARELTVLEDDIRRDGSITVKQPDVWGDANLVAFIQEHDELLAGRVRKFDETIQAYIARSDQAAVHAQTALGETLKKDDTAPPAASIASSSSSTNAVAKETIQLPTTDVFTRLEAALKAEPAKEIKGIGLEPTELARQHSTFIHVVEALRRRAMGDDNSRAAGYGLYKFRVPVSILPGRQTYRGYAAVATLRAQLNIDPAHLRYTFPKLAIADLVDILTPELAKEEEWKTIASKSGLIVTDVEVYEPKVVRGTPLIPGTAISIKDVYGEDCVEALRKRAVEHFGYPRPKEAELRAFLFRYFGQIQNILVARQAFDFYCEGLNGMPENLLIGAAEALRRGVPMTGEDGWAETWMASFRAAVPGDVEADADDHLAKTAWMLAIQSAILDRNLVKIVEEMYHEQKLPEEAVAISRQVQFFNPDHMPEETFRLWETLIREEFPLYVFTLDPQVEEQNVFDAFSRARELQLALAYSVATGRMNVAQRVNLARKLAMDMATIGLNRTQVAFSHGKDTFGWYFYPRVQTPPEETSNIEAFLRILWATGPTRRYDLAHREMEPGIRESEVLIAMPAFVTGVTFDVTTNWERITKPGASKRSYEEMIARGRQLQYLRQHLMRSCDQPWHRPGDHDRLASRLDQLEEMFSMQTYRVHVPYEYEQSGKDLFDTGDIHLRPVLHDYYGLDYVADTDTGSNDKPDPADEDPQASNDVHGYVFLTGKNFHPTSTHVIVGGHATDSLVQPKKPENGGYVPPPAAPNVRVISRELLQVRIPRLSKYLSKEGAFTVRVGTPAGVSNPLTIHTKPRSADVKPSKREPGAAEGGFEWDMQTTTFTCRLANEGRQVLPESYPQDDLLLSTEDDKFVPEEAKGALVVHGPGGSDGVLPAMEVRPVEGQPHTFRLSAKELLQRISEALAEAGSAGATKITVQLQLYDSEGVPAPSPPPPLTFRVSGNSGGDGASLLRQPRLEGAWRRFDQSARAEPASPRSRVAVE